MLMVVAALSAFLAVAGTVWASEDQRRREAELLHTGAEVRRAIGAYYESTPGTVKRYPLRLSDLLRDDRYVGIRRYLRKVPVDPMTRTINWGMIPAPDGGIMGIYSASPAKPFKTGNFSPLNSSLSKAASYADWHFEYTPAGQVNSPVNH